MSETKKTINGLTITVNFCKKINCSPIPSNEVSKGTPLANIYKKEGTTDNFVVNIVSHVPTTLNADTPAFPANTISLDNGAGKLNLRYNGTKDVKTSINQGDVNCRVFWFEYNGEENPTEFDLYHTQFVYTIDAGTASAEAIFVQECNDDPILSRGTVSTTEM